MERKCEVCAGSDEQHIPEKGNKLHRVVVQERIVALCEHHAKALALAEPRTLKAVRALFREENGRRSLLPRRSPLDRRVFPARPEGRRMGEGRRTDDVLE